MINKVVRYIGSKEKLTGFIQETINKSFTNTDNLTFVDGFTGTGVVSKFFYNSTSWNILAFDLSKYSAVFVKTIQIESKPERIEELLTELDSLPLLENGPFFNEFSKNGTPKTITDFSIFDNQESKCRLFFSEQAGKKIDTVKAELKKRYLNKEITEEEKDIVLLFLLNYADKTANTTSVFGAYLKRNLKNKEYKFKDPNLFNELKNRFLNNKNKKVEFAKGNIIEKIGLIPKGSIVYFDPPYNTRKYESNYHILNYLADLDFDPQIEIKTNSKTGLPKKQTPNLFGSSSGTKLIFEQMITESLKRVNKIFISYNNEGSVDFNFVKSICEKNRFSLTEHSMQYKKFTAGEARSSKSQKQTHVEELIWEISNAS